MAQPAYDPVSGTWVQPGIPADMPIPGASPDQFFGAGATVPGGGSTARTVDPVPEIPATPAEAMAAAGVSPGAETSNAPVSVAPTAAAAPDVAAEMAKIGPDTEYTRTVTTKDFAAANSALHGVEGEIVKTLDAKGKVDVKKAQEEAEQVKRDDELRAKLREEEAQQKIALQMKVDQATEAAKVLREQHQKEYAASFTQGKGQAMSWISALSAGLGAFSATVSGTPNFAWDVISKMMDQKAQRERERLQAQKEEIARTGGDVDRADQALKNFDSITRPQMEAAFLKESAERRASLMAKYGASDAKIAADQDRLKFLQGSLEKERQLQAGLSDKAKTDNAAQNKAKRDALGAGAAGKPNDSNIKAFTTIGTALDQVKKVGAETSEYSNKDRALIMKWSAIAREAPTTDPEKFAQFMAKMGGSGYIAQLSPDGRKRFNLTSSAIQDTERNLSGGSIQPHEMAATLELSTEKGGIRHVVDRIKGFTRMAGPLQAKAEELFAASGQAGTPSGGQPRAQLEPISKQEKSSRVAEATVLLRTARDPKMVNGLKWAAQNPDDPDAKVIIEAARAKR